MYASNDEMLREQTSICVLTLVVESTARLMSDAVPALNDAFYVIHSGSESVYRSA